MMNTTFYFKASIAGILVWLMSASVVQACPTGEPTQLDYIRRDDNRCEGIQTRRPTGGSLRLISFATRGINTFSEQLTIGIPRWQQVVPEVVMKAIEEGYQLDTVNLMQDSKTHRLSWSTYVLREAEILPQNLRATALSNNPKTYIPVIIGAPSPQYELVFYASRPTRFKNLQIQRDGTIVYETSKAGFSQGEIKFTWDGSNAPKGTYTVSYEAEIEQSGGRKPRVIPRSFQFVHDPVWLNYQL